LNGRAIRSLDDLYDQLARQLALPRHFGRNLDALWDLLSSDVEGPVEIVWQKAAASRKAMGADFDRAEQVLREVEKEREDFRLTIEP
jgi:ribonuclease inhibitor